ncbi:MAG: NAD-dependent epimerase/dehydratase family protein [Candidatus Paceibacterota bacterium]|jgi:nucleoside-diphosphate-sugar epimerase
MYKINENILVTGAGGFIGLHLSEQLVKNGHTVFGLAHSKIDKNLKNLSDDKSFHLIKGDVCDFDFINKTLKENKIKTIFHLAALLPGVADLDNPFPVFNVNTNGTLNLLSAAYKNNVERFIYASTMSVYTEMPENLPVTENQPTVPSTIYGISKLTGELLCGAYSGKMGITILRYGGAYGKNQHETNAVYRFIAQALKNEPITIYGSGKQSTDFVYIDDVVNGSILAAENNIQVIYNIGSGEETSIKELAEKIIKITESKSKIIFVDKETDRPFRFFLDVKKAKEKLGYSPLSLEKGLTKYISIFNK